MRKGRIVGRYKISILLGLTLQGCPAGPLLSLCPHLHSLSGPLTGATDTLFLAPHFFLCSDIHVVFLNQACSLIFLSLASPSPGGSVEVAQGFPEEGIPQCVGGRGVSADLSWWKVQGASCTFEQLHPRRALFTSPAPGLNSPVLGHLSFLTLHRTPTEASPGPCCSQPDGGDLSVEISNQTG